MSSINYLLIIRGIGLSLLSCVPSQSVPSQPSLGKSSISTKAIDMNDDQVSLPIKQKRRTSSDTKLPSSNELVLPDVYDGVNTLPLITQWKEAEAHDGKLVRVVGKYIESDVRMKPIGTPRYVGHVSIVLADDIRVSLFPVWQREARRPQAEIHRFKDQEVEVIGIFYHQSPLDPSGGASPLSPCLTEIKALY
jgi:hypothetical protein